MDIVYIMTYHKGLKMKRNRILACAISIIFVNFFFIGLSQASQQSKTIFSYGSIQPNMITYFQCSFSMEGPSIEPPVYTPEGLRIGYREGEFHPRNEPSLYPCEKGLWKWVNSRYWKDGTVSNMPTAGTLRLVRDPTDPSRLVLECLNDVEGVRPLSGAQHAKLYELQHIDSQNYGEPYLTSREAYYHTEYWFPEDWPELESHVLIWQICGEYGAYGNPTMGHMSPQMALRFVSEGWGYGDSLLFHFLDFYYEDGGTRRWPIIDRASIPKEQWVSIDVYVKQGSSFQSEDGAVIIWIDGEKLFEDYTLPTANPSGTPYTIWGIGNYGSSYEPAGLSLLIKNVVVSSSRYVG